MKPTRIELLQTALETSSKTVMDHFGKTLSISPNNETNKVTSADILSNKVIIELISTFYPNDAILSEETGFEANDSGYTWIIDPLDGTSNFIMEFPYFAIGIAIVKDDEVIASGASNPILNELIIAEKGSGSYQNGVKIQVDNNIALNTGFYIQGYDGDKHIEAEHFRKLYTSARRVLITWAPIIDFTMLAKGKAQFLVAYDTEVPEMFIGKLILEEAGGKLTGWHGNQLRIPLEANAKSSLIASNSVTHDLICELLN